MSKRRANTDLYHDDLAHIHVEGYGFHWSGAAEAILAWLQDCGITKGTVVDLGCGGGQWLQRLGEAGYNACGIDVSKSMIRIARQNAPAAKLLHGSFADEAIPACDAATSLGEPLNYLNSGPAMRRTMRHVFASLRPGGVFIFDVRHPAKDLVAPRDHHKASAEWFCHARIEEDFRRNQLTRHITTFRKLKNGKYRRDEEVHRLKVFSKAEVTCWLRAIGFHVRTRRDYGTHQLGPRQSVFVCRKPRGIARSEP
jgi:SAM-dependent methyltransferase